MIRAEFRMGVLGRLGVYQVGTWRALGGWELAESGERRCDAISGAKWNVLNTTQPWPDSTDFNSVHVKNYATYLDGVQATVATLTNGHYTALLAAMRKDGVSAAEVARAIAASPWGTLEADILNGLAAYQKNPAFYNGLPIGP